jgi:hypothetical protein
VNTPAVAVHGVRFDGASGRLFIRPNFTDALEFAVRRGAGAATGVFTRTFDLQADNWRTVDVKLTSTLDPAAVAPLLGPDAAQWLQPFSFALPPRIELDGHFSGPAAPGGVHRDFAVRVRSHGAMTYQGIPADWLTLEAGVRDDDVDVRSIRAGVAGGQLTAALQLRGPAARRHLGFTADVRDANLAQAAAILDAYSGRGHADKGPAANPYFRGRTDVHMNLSVKAQGVLGAYDFSGDGAVALRGGEIGQLRMLGGLSQVLPFTSLRFTAGQANFHLAGPRLEFPSVTVTGANSAISAHGTYSLETHQLDFRARLNPFQESRALPQKFMDVFLTPLSGVLEVRLTGPIEKPSWVFANGPGNWLKAPIGTEPLPPSPLKPRS